MIRVRAFALGIGILPALLAGLANAQVQIGTLGSGSSGPLRCQASVAMPPTLRAEGLTEPIGDLVLVCTGGVALAAGLPVPTANLTVSLGTAATSRVLATGLSDALLLVDEPGSGIWGPGPALPQTVCSSIAGAAPGGCAPLGTGTYVNRTGDQSSASFCTALSGGLCTAFGVTPNVFQGVVSRNQVIFSGIPILPPVVPGYARVFRMTNIRANAAALGLASPAPLMAALSVSSSTSVPIDTPVQSAGFVFPGLSASIRSASDATQGSTISSLGSVECSGLGTASSPVPGAVLRFQKNFGTAFKPRLVAGPQNIPGMIYNSESGLVISVPGGPGVSWPAGQSDYATRVKAVFSNVPPGVGLYVTTSNVQYGSGGQTLANAATFTDASGTLVYPVTGVVAPPVAFLLSSEGHPDTSAVLDTAAASTIINNNALALAPVQLVNGAGEAVWEVVATSPMALESLDFGVYVASAPQAGCSTAAAAEGLTMSFAPTANSPYGVNFTGGTSASSGPIPRFAVESLTLAPANETASVNTIQAATASVQGLSGDAVAGRVVNFSVIGGPNAQATGNCTTGAAGTCTFSYGSTMAGTDTLQASMTDSLGAVQKSNTVNVTWQGANLLTYAVAFTNTLGETTPVNQEYTLNCKVTDNLGRAVSGKAVTFTALSGPRAGLLGTVTTNSSGIATEAYTSSAAGTDTLQCSIAGPVTSTPITHTWAAVSAPSLFLTVSAATNPVKGRETFTVNAVNGSGSPLVGQSFTIATTSGPNHPLMLTGTTGAGGIGTAFYSSAVAGTDVWQATATIGGNSVNSNAVNSTWAGLLCDANGDAKVNILDINLIRAALNQPAAPGDPRDANFDRKVDTTDATLCVKACTKPGCAQ